MIHQLAQRITEQLQKELNLENSRTPIIVHGLEVIIGAMVRLLSFVAISSILGILPQTLAALLGSGLFRLPAGGAHCTAYYRCLIGSLLTFCVIGVLTKIIANYNFPIGAIFGLSIGLAAFVTAFWVPAGTKVKPMTDPSDRKRAKIWAYGVLFIYFSLWYFYKIPQDIILAGSLGLLLQVFTLTPVGFKAMDKLDIFLLKMSNRWLERG